MCRVARGTAVGQERSAKKCGIIEDTSPMVGASPVRVAACRSAGCVPADGGAPGRLGPGREDLSPTTAA